MALVLALAMFSVGTGQLRPITANGQGGDGVERVWSLLVNAIPVGVGGQAAVVNDVDHLSAALAVDIRPHAITTMGGAAGPAAPANPAALTAAIPAAFNPSDGDDVCIFYMGTHGGQVPDNNGDEADGLDGIFLVGNGFIRDDDLAVPFNALLPGGHCGHGLVLMFMSCHSGELLHGTSDLALPGPYVMTSCTSAQTSAPCVVGGHDHSCFGGAAVTGLSDTNGDGFAEADIVAPLNHQVTFSELSAYVVVNDTDPGADPETAAPAVPGPVVLAYSGVAAHAAGVVLGAIKFCQLGGTGLGVGGVDEPLSSGDLPTTTGGSSGSSLSLGVALVVAAAVGVVLVVGGWYAKRRWLG